MAFGLRHRIATTAAGIAGLVALAPAPAAAAPASCWPAGATGSRVVLEFAKGTTRGERAAVLRAVRAKAWRQLGTPRLRLVRLPQKSAGAALCWLAKSPDVAWVEADRPISGVGVDTAALAAASRAATGATAGTAGGVLVAVVGTGVRLVDGVALAPLVRNAGEDGRDARGKARRKNRVDDDGNGLVDDWRGWDWARHDNAPEDPDGQGTALARSAVAGAHDLAADAGLEIAPRVLPLRVLDGAGRGVSSSLIAAYAYAGAAGADVVVSAVGAAYDSPALRRVIARYPGTLFVNAAGDDAADRDARRLAPCGGGLANLLCVAASTGSGALAAASAYGDSTVDLAAPGDATGAPGATSALAAARVAAVAVAVRAARPSLTATAVRDGIASSAAARPGLAGRVRTGAELDADAALALLADVEPQPDVTAPEVASVTATRTPGTRRVRVAARIDANGGDTRAWAEIDGTATRSADVAVDGESTAAPASFTLDLPAGTADVAVVATNAAGSTRSDTVTVVVPGSPDASRPTAAVADAAVALAATVDTHGEAASAWFEWGVGSAFDAATAAHALAAANGPQALAADLVDVPAGTYAVRVAMQVGDAVTHGAARSFTVAQVVTPPPPAAPEPGAASATSDGATGASLSAPVTTHQAAEAWFEWGLGTAYDHATAHQALAASGSSVAVAATLAGLVPGSTYRIRLAVRAGETTVRGADAVLAVPQRAPEAGAASATPSGATGASLAAVATTHQAVEAWFEWGLGTAYDHATPHQALPAADAPVTVTGSLSGLVAGGSYRVRLVLATAATTVRGTEAALTVPLDPGSRHVLLGSWVYPEDGDLSEAGQKRGIGVFESDIARDLEIMHFYYPWTSAPVGGKETWAISQGATPLVSWNGSASALGNIVSGSQDAYITSAATRFKNLGAPVFLRFAWEMDAPTRGYVPATYIAAWRHLHELFDAAGATNVDWVWCPNAWAFDAASGRHPTDWYPGDDVVDWTCADGYSWYPEKGSFASFEQIFRSFYAWASTKGKPIMIGETNAMEDPAVVGRKGDWYRDMARQIRCRWPQIGALVLYNENKHEEGVVRDWRIRTSTTATAGFRDAANDGIFGGANGTALGC